MILFFSGTGNSGYAARLVSQITGDTAISINKLIKNGDTYPLSSDKPFVFVCPVYAYRIPHVVERFIRSVPLAGSRQAYFILTCGDSSGAASHYNEQLCRDIGLAYMGTATIVMPENYIAMFKVPDEKEAEAIVKRAHPHILEAAGLIKEQQPLPPEKITMAGRFISAAVNGPFYKLFVSAKGFYATDDCVGCGKCADVCPLNNISILEGRPQWGSDCTHCMACICLCPTQAIEYKKKSQDKNRYHLD